MKLVNTVHILDEILYYIKELLRYINFIIHKTEIWLSPDK